MSRKTSRKSRLSRWTINHPLSANLRRFQSNQSISNINNIDMDLFIESFDRKNAKINENSDVVNLY